MTKHDRDTLVTLESCVQAAKSEDYDFMGMLGQIEFSWGNMLRAKGWDTSILYEELRKIYINYEPTNNVTF